MVSPYAHRQEVVIATPTFYRNVEDPRYRLALKTIEAAQTAQYPICVVDGSPDPKIKAEFRDRGAVVYPEVTRGLGAVKRYSFYHAVSIALSRHRTIVVHIEPEKHDMIRHIPLLVEQILLGEADVIVATRGDGSWLSYPEFQVQTEREMNAAFRQYVGIDVDIAVGPGAFRIDTAGYFFVDGNYTSTGIADTYAQHYGVIAAHAHDLRIAASVPLDFIYPAEQRAQEEEEIAAGGPIKQKRLDQLASLSAAYEKLARHFRLPRNPSA
ncbi:MAG: hypothetical protein Q8R39_04720 [bacterium]|nr:hypothetical protein [bacterium]MDZ4285036.1 hypothetical protein [Patescibacteria group bacterium]